MELRWVTERRGGDERVDHEKDYGVHKCTHCMAMCGQMCAQGMKGNKVKGEKSEGQGVTPIENDQATCRYTQGGGKERRGGGGRESHMQEPHHASSQKYTYTYIYKMKEEELRERERKIHICDSEEGIKNQEGTEQKPHPTAIDGMNKKRGKREGENVIRVFVCIFI